VVNLIHNPEVAHFHGTGPLSFDSVVGNADGRLVVAMDRGRRLRMAHLLQDDAQDFGLFGIEVQGAKFRFGGGGGDVFQDGAERVDGTVEANRLIVLWQMAQAIMATSRAAGLGLIEIRGVGVDLQDHVGQIETDDSIRMRMKIIQQLVGADLSGLGWMALLAGFQNGGINGAAVVEEGANNLHDAFLFGLREEW
jgi:hypothetical protein